MSRLFYLCFGTDDSHEMNFKEHFDIFVKRMNDDQLTCVLFGRVFCVFSFDHSLFYHIQIRVKLPYSHFSSFWINNFFMNKLFKWVEQTIALAKLFPHNKQPDCPQLCMYQHSQVNFTLLQLKEIKKLVENADLSKKKNEIHMIDEFMIRDKKYPLIVRGIE